MKPTVSTSCSRAIEISVRSRGFRVVRPDLRKLVTYSLDSEEAAPHRGLSLIFCGDRMMRRLNRTFRDKDRTTDVLSFPDPEEIPLPPGETALPLGEVVVSIPQCRRQAMEQGVLPGVELVRLIVHGTLHVLGFDHERPEDQAVMVPRERRYRAWAKRQGIGPGLLQFRDGNQR